MSRSRVCIMERHNCAVLIHDNHSVTAHWSSSLGRNDANIFIAVFHVWIAKCIGRTPACALRDNPVDCDFLSEKWKSLALGGQDSGEARCRLWCHKSGCTADVVPIKNMAGAIIKLIWLLSRHAGPCILLSRSQSYVGESLAKTGESYYIY
jgi:hypothetical protein